MALISALVSIFNTTDLELNLPFTILIRITATKNQRSTLLPFVAPPPLLLFTSLTDLDQHTAAK